MHTGAFVCVAALSGLLACAASESPSAPTPTGAGGGGVASCDDVTWGLGDSDERTLDAYLAGSRSVAAAADELAARVTASCEKLAEALGAPPDAVDASTPAAAMDGWCREAGERLGSVAAQLVVSAQRPFCEFDGMAQGTCESTCAQNPSCAVVDVAFRCSEVAGSCPGPCAGTCDGSTDTPVTCAATCDGSCAGTCDGTSEGTACDGVCTGPCRGGCSSVIGMPCVGSCFGACGGELTSVVCRAPLAEPEPSCQGDLRCSAACAAAAAAAASCPDVGVGVGAIGTPPAALVPTLQVELPAILACRTRAAFLRDAASSLADVGQGLTPVGAELSEAAAQCLVSAVGAAQSAAEEITATAAACFRVEDALSP